MIRICSECGIETPGDASFCHKCGTNLAPFDDAGAPEEETSPSAHDASQSPAAEAVTTEDSHTEVSHTGAAPAEGSPAERFRSGMSHDSADVPEESLWEGTYSGRAMLGTWALFGLGSLVIIIAAASWGLAGGAWWWLLGAILVVGVGLYARLLYRQMSVHYALTTQRFVHELGLLRRMTDRIEVIDMDDITVEQGLVQRLLGVGTIKISSSDRTHPEILLHGIDQVKQVSIQFDDARRAERRRRGLHIESI